MYDKKILKSACDSVIELADSCIYGNRFILSNIYHLIKFVRSAVRDYSEDSAEFSEMLDTLNLYSAIMRRLTHGNISQYKVVFSDDEGNKIGIFPLPIANVHSAMLYMIRCKLKDNDTACYIHLHNIAALYVPYFFDFSDKLDSETDFPYWYLADSLTYSYADELGNHIGLLEKAMDAKRIPYENIIV